MMEKILIPLCGVIASGFAIADPGTQQAKPAPEMPVVAGSSGDVVADNQVRKPHRRLDANGDGFITKDEVPEFAWQRLSKHDSDGDGKISKEERPQRAPRGKGHPRGEQFFNQLDTDGNGEISEAEAGDRWQRMGRADVDNSGSVTKEELRSAMTKLRGKGPRLFERADANKDGVLTQDELDQRRWQRLSIADADRDGALTREELRAAWEARKRDMQPSQSPGSQPAIPARPPLEL